MSNDAKLWAWRVVVFVMLSIDGAILTKAITPSSPQAGVSQTWFIVFFIVCILNIPVYVLYLRAKAGRWTAAEHKTQEQIQVETLAAAAQFAQTKKQEDQQTVQSQQKPPVETPKQPPAQQHN